MDYKYGRKIPHVMGPYFDAMHRSGTTNTLKLDDRGDVGSMESTPQPTTNNNKMTEIRGSMEVWT